MKVPVPEVVPGADQLGRVHFVGIGGAGLSGIARIMLARGITVSGSDAVDSPGLRALEALGARVAVGHDAANVRDVDTLVVSVAVRDDNPEVAEARRHDLLVLPRSAAVASVLVGRRAVAVAGTHGKTTTTSLLTVALQAAGADPSYAVGGDLAQTGTNAAEGGSDLFVIEADESDGAFLVYRPFAAIVTNVEADHLDQWGTEAAYRLGFEEFVGHIEPEGFLVVCADDPGAAALVDVARARGLAVHAVGEATTADVRCIDLAFEGETSSFTVVDEGAELGRVSLRIPGRHYVLDALAALTVGLRLGLSFDALRRGLEAFSGTRRRMERKGEAAGVRVYDSYAHHPAEIAGDLQAARAVAGEGRLIVVFQPHMVSRTRIFGAEMGAALGAADEVVVLDIYLAREEVDPAVTGALVADAVPLPPGRVAYVDDLAAAPAEAVARARPGDLVLTLGAGNVTELGPRILDALAVRGG